MPAAGAPSLIDTPAPLIAALQARGRRVVAPVERHGTLDFDVIAGPEDLPRGRVDVQGPGRFRLEDGDPGRWFDHVVGPKGPKHWLFPPDRRLVSVRRGADGLEFDDAPEPFPPTAFLGVRACEIAAMDMQARVFASGAAPDPDFARRRAACLVIAVQCARAAPTCFCDAQETGPRAETGWDLALTELDGRLLLEVGTAAGDEIAADLETRPAAPADLAEARAATARAAAAQTRALPPTVAEALAATPEHPRWDDVAARCLDCGNCTAACPTCFCSDVIDVGGLDPDASERRRVWRSCFALDFSEMHGGAVRSSTKSRYRQWLTHKLSHWHAQFGASGCVGCGRCIAWCPAAIDLTEEAAAISAGPGPGPGEREVGP